LVARWSVPGPPEGCKNGTVRAWSLVPLCLAALEVVHPGATGESVSETVRSASPWWVPLHVLLLLGYPLLVASLWRLTNSKAAHAVLAIFAACNSLYVAVDGIAVGMLAQADPTTADALWSTTWVNVLGNVTGAAWAASLLLVALSLTRRNDLAVRVGSTVTWLAFVATTLPVSGGFAISLSRIPAVATGAWTVYQGGAARIPVALLIFAAVLRQHVGAEAAFGLVLIAIATGRSVPAVASLP